MPALFRVYCFGDRTTRLEQQWNTASANSAVWRPTGKCCVSQDYQVLTLVCIHYSPDPSSMLVEMQARQAACCCEPSSCVRAPDSGADGFMCVCCTWAMNHSAHTCCVRSWTHCTEMKRGELLHVVLLQHDNAVTALTVHYGV